MALLDYGYESFETHKLYSAGEAIAQARIRKGSVDTVALGPADDVFVTVPRGEYSRLGASAAVTTELVAPLARDRAVGELEISLGDQSIALLPLVALDGVEEGWLLTRLVDGVAVWLE